MKLPIRKVYFDQLKLGKKKVEFRDAHLTFVCIETREVITIPVKKAEVVPKCFLPKELQNSKMFTDEQIIRFWLK